MFFPIGISFVFIVIQAIVSTKGYVWGSVTVAAIYTALIIFFFQSYELIAILYLVCCFFWIISAATFAMRWI
ncbi:hypothetical protein [Psychrobacillus sp.]|uniref:hypothetical protein n=1 Tax=Psychrobacillus sp. TaxID=1871623 RepID=UPI0028BEC2F6|nr:hypothetical protein [Psychrobacillus sp.]